MQPSLIVDAHEDLAYNMLTFGRDYTRSVAETRRIEMASGSEASLNITAKPCSAGPNTNADEWLSFSALCSPHRSAAKRMHWDKQAYADYNQAHHLYRTQLDTYHELADRFPDLFQFIATRADLETVLAHWADPSSREPPCRPCPVDGRRRGRAQSV